MFQYYIDYNIIPFSSNIENNCIKLEESVNIIVPNYKQKYENDEKYFIYFRFEKNDTNIIIKQFEETLNIKFNKTDYESKIEYNIIIFENNNNFKNITKYLYHEIVNNKSFIYKNIINSIGIVPISIDINIDKFLSDEKSYIAFILEHFENSFHYIYYDPEEFIVTKNKNESEKSEENNKSNIINRSNTGTIVGIIFGVIGFIGFLFGGFLIYRYRKRIKNENLILLDKQI